MKTTRFYQLVAIISFSFFTFSCSKTFPDAPEENLLLDGPIEGLTTEQQIQFLKGDVAFNDDIFTVEKGLGPIFNANSCATCHAGDGKGHPFIGFTRFGQTDATGNKFLNQGAPQLQNKAIPGYTPETLPAGATFSNLLAPAVTGLGLLDAVSDADLIALSDPNDTNNDGISGVPHWNNIPEYAKAQLRPNTITNSGKYITRFGKKGAAYNLLQQTSEAYNQDMGVASIFEAIDTYSGLEIDPEVATDQVNDVVFYLKTLKAPLRRNETNPDVLEGEKIFSEMKCASCHTPTLQTGPSTIEALSNKTFHPYTDLLLHDMGAQLDDNYTEGFALTSEWKTPALWGLGLSPESQGGTYFLMHDGRAKSLEEAILLHGGEALQAKNDYKQLMEAKKQQVLKFLESL
jgi:CxxC motif-containing protein (DUF1111 family)